VRVERGGDFLVKKSNKIPTFFRSFDGERSSRDVVGSDNALISVPCSDFDENLCVSCREVSSFLARGKRRS